MNVREELKAFHDNELSPEHADQVREALRQDPALAAEYAEIASLSQILRQEAVPSEVRGKEATLSKLESRRRPQWNTPVTWIAGSCAAVLACIVMFPVFAQSKSVAKSEAMMEAAKSVASAAPADRSMPMEATGGFGGEAAAAVESDKNVAAQAQPERALSRGPVLEGGSISRLQVKANSTSLIVKNANLALEVKSVTAAQSAVETLIRSSAGVIQSANKAGMPEGDMSLTMTLRVPSPRFESSMQALRKIGKVISESMNGEDVTAQVADTEARLKTLRAEEAQYRVLLGQTKSIGQVIQVREKLSEVRQTIESLDAQRLALRNQAQMSTIELSVLQRALPAEMPTPRRTSWSEEAWESAMGALAALGRGVGTAGINLLVFSPVWLTLGLVGWLVTRRR